jgi:aarF domain-containing kinase
VTEVIDRDFELMRRSVGLLSALPWVSFGRQLEESLMQFGAPLHEQLDLRTEAEHLDRFGRNFKVGAGAAG